jgi:hypothetical protein
VPMIGITSTSSLIGSSGAMGLDERASGAEG